MQFKTLTLASLAGLAAAQSSSNMTLTEALNSSSQLSGLSEVLALVPDLASQLANLTNITIFAPSNDAFSTFQNSSTFQAAQSDSGLLTSLLMYHVLNGSYSQLPENRTFLPTLLTNETYTNVTSGQVLEVLNSTVYSGLRDNSTVMGSAVNFTGGVIHMIDSVLTLPQPVSDTLSSFNLSSAYGALDSAGLLDTVDGLSNITLFIPNNDAFQAIGSALPGLNMTQLTSILTYHVVNSTIAYSTTLSNTSVPTLEGTDLNITVSSNGSRVYVNNARVVIPNILIANGVAHIIDEVLNPNNNTVSNGTSDNGEPAFSGASSATDVPFTSNVPAPTTTINTASLASDAATQPAGGSSSSSAGAWSPKATGAGAVAAAAIGGLALFLQL